MQRNTLILGLIMVAFLAFQTKATQPDFNMFKDELSNLNTTALLDLLSDVKSFGEQWWAKNAAERNWAIRTVQESI